MDIGKRDTSFEYILYRCVDPADAHYNLSHERARKLIGIGMAGDCVWHSDFGDGSD
jgi:hypothetical protein